MHRCGATQCSMRILWVTTSPTLSLPGTISSQYLLSRAFFVLLECKLYNQIAGTCCALLSISRTVPEGIRNRRSFIWTDHSSLHLSCFIFPLFQLPLPLINHGLTIISGKVCKWAAHKKNVCFKISFWVVLHLLGSDHVFAWSFYSVCATHLLIDVSTTPAFRHLIGQSLG